MELLPQYITKRCKKVFIRGYYGYRNIGDEAMLYVLLSYLKNIGLEPIVASKDVKYTKKIHKTNSVYSSFTNIPKILRYILSSDILIEGPGNKHGFMSIIDLGLPLIAKLFRKKIVYLGVGISPYKWKEIPTVLFYKKAKRYGYVKRFIIRFWFNFLTDYISVRDELTKNFLIENGVSKNKINMICDLGFHLPTLSNMREVKKIFFKLSSPTVNINELNEPKIIVGVSVRKFRSEKINNEVKNFLEKLIQKFRATLKCKIIFLFFPFSFGKFDNDLLYSQELISHFKLRFQDINFHILKTDNPIYIKSVFKICNLIIGIRYHSHIFAESLQIPYLAIIYDPKSFQVIKNSIYCFGFSEINLINKRVTQLTNKALKIFIDNYDIEKYGKPQQKYL
ncbi:MAG: polysaccharide pyruvyl transferase family protein [Candidatus Aenigmatarchaeota archaeon]